MEDDATGTEQGGDAGSTGEGPARPHPVGNPDELGPPPSLAAFLIATFLVIGVPAGLCAGVFWVGHSLLPRSGGTIHELRRTGDALASIKTSLRHHVERDGALPATDPGQLTDPLIGPDDPVVRSADSPDLIWSGGRLADAWGQPLRYRFDGRVARVWSIGANARDEGGGGDDMVIRVRVERGASRR